MSEEVHVVCDQCGARKPGTLIGTMVGRPPTWIGVAGKDFCSWMCVAKYAQGRAEA